MENNLRNEIIKAMTFLVQVMELPLERGLEDNTGNKVIINGIATGSRDLKMELPRKAGIWTELKVGLQFAG